MKIIMTLKKIVVAITILIIFLIALLIGILAAVSHKPTAAFYGISERNRNAISEVLQTTYTRKNKNSLPFNIVVFDDSNSLEKELKKNRADIVFINCGANAEFAELRALKKRTYFDFSVLNGMSNSIKQVAPVQNNKVLAVPLLVDNYELDVNLERFNATNIKNLKNLADLEQYSRFTKSSSPYSLVFPAGDDEYLINVFGAFVEATSGRNAWLSAEIKIRDAISTSKGNYNSYVQIIRELSSEGAEFYNAVNLIKDWHKSEILPKNFLQINIRDVKSFVASKLCSSAIITLSDHRTFDRTEIASYTSVYIPSVNENSERSFSSPVLLGISLSKNKVARNAISKLADSLQSQLSIKTGLAPVQANCSVPDVQADDVRYWVAASNPPLPAFSDALFTTKQQKALFADALRSCLRQ